MIRGMGRRTSLGASKLSCPLHLRMGEEAGEDVGEEKTGRALSRRAPACFMFLKNYFSLIFGREIFLLNRSLVRGLIVGDGWFCRFG